MNLMNTKIQSISLNSLWHQLRSRPLMRDTLTTTFFSTAGKSVAFLVPFFIAAWFGVTAETDAFFFAYGLILFISGVFAPVVESVIVPYIAEARAKGNDVGRFVGNVLGVSGLSLLVLSAALLTVMKPALALGTRFDAETLNLVFRLLVETSPLFILLVWTSVLAGTLNAHKKFVFPALSPGFRAIIILGLIFIFKDAYGVHAIALGYVAGEVIRLIILVGVCKQTDLFRIRFFLSLEPTLGEFSKTAAFQIIGMVAVGLNPIVDKAMASWVGKGSVSILHYADRLYMIPITFITTGLMVTLLSHWSERYYEWGRQGLNNDVKKTLKIVGLAALLITVFLVLIHKSLVHLAYGRGAFDSARLPEIGWVWVCYLLGFIPYMIGWVYVRAHLVLKNTRILMINAFYLFGLNILLNFLLMRFLGVAGIALATTFASLFSLFHLGSAFYKNSSE